MSGLANDSSNPRERLPLCVDLDGTLLKTDTLIEGLLAITRRRPFELLKLPRWLLEGRARFKRRVADVVDLDVQHLPANRDLLHYLMDQERQGREIILATGADSRVAEGISRRFPIFSRVVSSDGDTNLTGSAKARLLEELFGTRGFVYAGNCRSDLKVWKKAEGAIVVGTERLANEARNVVTIDKHFRRSRSRLKAIIREIRLYQWVKSLLVFVPLIGAHRLAEVDLLWRACLAFLALSLCASAGYVLNDLFDLESDRMHPGKRNRPLASGEVPVRAALALVPIFLTAGILLGALLSGRFVALLMFYCVSTISYTLVLKRVALLDVFILAGLYALRLFAGELVTGVPVSDWLLVMCIFAFLSLALLKRYSELCLDVDDQKMRKARGYLQTDKQTLLTLGLGAGCVASLVLGLYVQSGAVTTLYSRPRLLWLLCPLALFWMARVWLLASRGLVHHDPVLFAVKDRVSYLTDVVTGVHDPQLHVRRGLNR